MQKPSTNSFSFAFLSCRYGFTNYFERPIFIFSFSNIIAKGVSTSELVPPEIKSSKNQINLL